MEEVTPPSRERIIEALRQAGEGGLTKTAIAKALAPAGKKLRQTRDAKAAAEDALRQAVQRLEADREAVNFGTDKSPCYVLAEFDSRLALACETLESMATPGRATVYNLAALRKGHLKPVTKAIVDEAIEKLLREHRLIAIQPGKTIFYLHARSVAPLISFDWATDSGSARPEEASHSPTIPRGDVFSPEAARAAYSELVREGGFADVPISELHRRSGMPLADLQAWLLEQSREGRAAPTRGDWSLAGRESRAAAIDVRGEPHLQVRLL
jgi:hypothetical protein